MAVRPPVAKPGKVPKKPAKIKQAPLPKPGRKKVAPQNFQDRSAALMKKRRKRARMSRFRHIAFGLLAVLSLIILGIALFTSLLTPVWLSAQQSVLHRTRLLGFVVQDVHIYGLKHVDAATVLATLGLDRPTEPVAILALDLSDMAQKLETLPWVAPATISRTLPDMLIIHIEEKKPVALWQYQQRLHLIDVQGEVLQQEQLKEYLQLPLVVGKGAAQHVAQALQIREIHPILREEVTSFVRVGGRRWNVLLKSGMTVLLPEKDPVGAWGRFARLQAEENLLQKAVKRVDMRLEDRIFLTPDKPE